MIRRDAISPAGEKSWVLISQVEHAHLASDLAKHWDSGGFAPLASRETLLSTIEHHDDGWAHWEAEPQIDPKHGRPYSFTEMPLEVALNIWSQSISKVETISPLAPWLVAGHFCQLLRGSSNARQPVSQRWLTDIGDRRARWLALWQAEDPEQHSDSMAQRALEQLQFFDSLSLWFCCVEHTQPSKLQTPGGQTLTLDPKLEGLITVSPWPLTVDALAVEVTGRRVDARRYADDRALASEEGDWVRLSWKLDSVDGDGVRSKFSANDG